MSMVIALFQYAILKSITYIGFPITYITMYFNDKGGFSGIHFNPLNFLINVALCGITYKLIVIIICRK